MTRRTLPLLLTALFIGLLPSAARADATGATVDKTGWWNRANTQTSTPAGPVTVPPPPGIPEGSLVVSAAGPVGDEPSAIAAVGIQPDEGPGATIERFTMRISEDPDARGNQGTGGAVILACPITDFWAGGENAPWDTRPVDDCEAAKVTGERDDEGTWTFDLAPIGSVWFDSFGGIVADGVVLRPDLEQTSPFQAVFDEESIDIELVAEPAPGSDDDPFASPGFSDPVETDSGLSAGGGSGGIISTPVITSPPETSFDTPSDTPVEPGPSDGEGSGEETAAPPAASPDTEPAASRAGDVFGNLSPLVFLGILLFAGLLLTTSYWFGPNGQPVATVRRRGVSRALDARSRATKGNAP